MFRRSGSFASFSVHGAMPAAGSPEFCAALAAQRFRSIETAAGEQVAVGWVTPGDPTGESFEVEDMDRDAAWWLRLRIDKKRLPAAWLAIYACAAARSRGRPLTRRERRELRDDLERKLLPRVLPTVAMIDVLYVPDRRRIHLFSTAVHAREEFAKLFHRTFAAHAVAVDPRSLAQELDLGREQHAYLDQVTPVRWPRERAGTAAAQPIPTEAAAREAP